MKKVLILFAALFLPATAGATVTSTASTVSFTCTNSTGPFPFTFPALNAGALQVTEQAAGAVPGVMTVLAADQWTATPVNNSYANGGSITLVTACPAGDTLTIARTTEPTQQTVYSPFMPALYANVEANLDQLSTGVQDTLRLDQLHLGNVTGSGSATLYTTPLGQYLNLDLPQATGGGCSPGGSQNAIQTNNAGGCAGSLATADAPGNLAAASATLTGRATGPDLPSNVINVAHLPAPVLGDGSDQSANMATAAALCGTGRSLYFPPPATVYYWTSTVRLPDNCTAFGEYGLSLVDGRLQLGNNNQVHGLTWIADATVNFKAITVSSDGAGAHAVSNIEISRNQFLNVTQGVFIDQPPNNETVSAVNMHDNICTNVQFCSYVVRVNNSNFDHNVVNAGTVYIGLTTYGAFEFNSRQNTTANYNTVNGNGVAIVGILDLPRSDINRDTVSPGFTNNQTNFNQISGVTQESISEDIFGSDSAPMGVREQTTVSSTNQAGGFFQLVTTNQSVETAVSSCTYTGSSSPWTISCTMGTTFGTTPVVNQGVGIHVTSFLDTGYVNPCTVTSADSTHVVCTETFAQPSAASGTSGTVHVGFYSFYTEHQWMCFTSGLNEGNCANVIFSSSTTNTLNISASQFALIAPGDGIVIGYPFLNNQIVGNQVKLPQPVITPYTVTAASYTGTGPYTISLTLSATVTGVAVKDAIQMAVPSFLTATYLNPCIVASVSGTSLTCTSPTLPSGASASSGTISTANVSGIGTYGIGIHGFGYHNTIQGNNVFGNNWSLGISPDRDRGIGYSVQSLAGLVATGAFSYGSFSTHSAPSENNNLSANVGVNADVQITGYDYGTGTYMASYSRGNNVIAQKGSLVNINAQIVRLNEVYQDPIASTPSTTCSANNLGAVSYYNPATGAGAGSICSQTGTATYAWQAIQTGAPLTKTISWSGFGQFAATAIGEADGNLFTLAQIATLTYFTVYYTTSGVGCSTAPVISVYDKTSSSIVTSLTLANGTNSFNSGALSLALAAHQYSIRWTTAAVGCSTTPVNIHFLAVYQQ